MSAATDLPSRILELAANQGTREALIAPSRVPMDFGALAGWMVRLASQLDEWGIRRGDALAWLAADRAQTALALAALPASATLVPIAASATLDSLLGLLPRLRPKAVVVPAGTEPAIAEAASRLGVAVLSSRDDGAAAGAFDLALERPRRSLDQAHRHSSEWAIIGATSGSTGRPKLVPLGHRQILLTAFATAPTLGLGPGDISGHVMPLHLSGGMRTSFFQSLLVGGAVNVQPEADLEALLGEIGAGRVTYVSASFTMLREMLARLESGRDVGRGRLRLLRVASGRMEPREMDELERRMGVPVVTGLASSETGTTAQQRIDAPRTRGSVGRPVASEVRLVDGDGRDVPPGGTGEILVRSAQLCPGYLDDDELTSRAFADGWFRMGDLARFDSEGELHLVGRVKDVINRGGEKISPQEIEVALMALPEVADAAAFGVAHPRLGEEVVAAVVPATGPAPQADAILERLRVLLGARRTPRRLWFVPSLPRGDGGKLMRSSLPAWVGYEAHPREAPHDHAPGKSAVEAALAALWQRVLGVAVVRANDDFRALGGTDEMAVALVAQVRAVFAVEVPAPVDGGATSTLEGMAGRIERGRQSSSNP